MNANLKIKEKALPYYWLTDSDTIAILIHGFTSSPDDMRELAKFLHETLNISIKAPLLAGHGSHWTKLEEVSYYDWWKSVDDEIQNLSEQFKKIYLIGYSFGGNLALDLAARYPEKINGVVTLGVSVFLRKEFWIKFYLPIMHLLFKRYRKPTIGRKILAEYEESGSYAMIPTKSLYNFFAFIKTFTYKELGKVKVPSLIIHSKDDVITHPLSSQFVHDRLGSEKKELLILEEYLHNPIKSLRREIIFNKIKDFIAENGNWKMKK